MIWSVPSFEHTPARLGPLPYVKRRREKHESNGWRWRRRLREDCQGETAKARVGDGRNHRGRCSRTEGEEGDVVTGEQTSQTKLHPYTRNPRIFRGGGSESCLSICPWAGQLFLEDSTCCPSIGSFSAPYSLGTRKQREQEGSRGSRREQSALWPPRVQK